MMSSAGSLWVVAAGVVWYLSSILVNTEWKKAVHERPYVLALTMIQFAIGELIVIPTCIAISLLHQRVSGFGIRYGERQQASAVPKTSRSTGNEGHVSLSRPKLSMIILVFIGIAFAIGQLCTNKSLEKTSIGLTHLVKITEPCLALVISVVILKNNPPSEKALFFMLLLLVGVGIAGYSDDSFTFSNILFAGLSNIALQLRNMLLKMIKDDSGFENNGIMLFLYSNTVGLVFLLFLMIPTYGLDNAWHIVQGIDQHCILAGVFFSFQHIMSYVVLRNISITTHALLNVMKRVVIIILSSVIMQVKLTYLQILGISLAATGFYFYTKAINKKTDYKVKKMGWLNKVVGPCMITLKSILKIIAVMIGIFIVMRPISFRAINSVKNVAVERSPITLIWAYTVDPPGPALELVRSLIAEKDGQKVVVYCGTATCHNAIRALDSKHNVELKQLNVLSLTTDTTIHSWVKKYPIMRILMGPKFEPRLQAAVYLATLWKEGGIVVDLGIPVSEASILVPKLRHMPENSCVLDVNDTFLRVCHLRHRHHFIEEQMQNFLANFNLAWPLKAAWPLKINATESLYNTFLKCGRHNQAQQCPRNVRSEFKDLIHFSSMTYFHPKREFAILSYNHTKNLGDEIQSIAAAHFVPRVDVFVPRDNEVHLKNNVTMLTNAWWTTTGSIYKLNSKITPVLVAVHLDKMWTKVVKHRIQMLKPLSRAYGPIGTRDSATSDILKAFNISAVFTGCLTLFIQHPFKHEPKSGITYLVDTPNDILKIVRPFLGYNTKKLNHEGVGIKNEMHRFVTAYNYLEQYSRAKLVITQRLHVALPCVAFGTPVVVFRPYDNRYHGLSKLFHYFDTKNSKHSKQNLHHFVRNFNWTHPPPNPNEGLARELRATAWSFMKGIPEFRDVRNMFDLRP